MIFVEDHGHKPENNQKRHPPRTASDKHLDIFINASITFGIVEAVLNCFDIE